MSLVLPDLVIVDTLNIALKAIREDYATCLAASQENRSVLYLLFNGLTTGKYDLYNNVKKLIITTNENPKHLEVVSSFQSISGKSPAVYVTMPSENDKNNSVGIGVGNTDELLFDNPSDQQDEYRSQYMRRYATNYYVVVIAENRNEMVVLYNLFKYLLVICTNHFALEGIENLKVGGQDMRLNDSVPDKLFVRGISMNFEYEQLAPELAFNKVYSKVRLYWKPEGATTAQGPIEFTP